MKISNSKVYHWFWIVSIITVVILLVEYYNDSDSAIAINIHDTYYVIVTYQFLVLTAIVYFLFGIGYWLMIKVLKRKLIKILTLIHSVLFIGGFMTYWVVYGYDSIQKEKLGILHDSDFLNKTILVLLLIMLITTLIYFINLIISIFRKPT